MRGVVTHVLHVSLAVGGLNSRSFRFGCPSFRKRRWTWSSLAAFLTNAARSLHRSLSSALPGSFRRNLLRRAFRCRLLAGYRGLSCSSGANTLSSRACPFLFGCLLSALRPFRTFPHSHVVSPLSMINFSLTLTESAFAVTTLSDSQL
jgi:hypothetical protein